MFQKKEVCIIKAKPVIWRATKPHGVNLFVMVPSFGSICPCCRSCTQGCIPGSHALEVHYSSVQLKPGSDQMVIKLRMCSCWLVTSSFRTALCATWHLANQCINQSVHNGSAAQPSQPTPTMASATTRTVAGNFCLPIVCKVCITQPGEWGVNIK